MFLIKHIMHSVSIKIAIAFFIASALPLVVGFGVINSQAHDKARLAAERKLVEIAHSRERLLSSHIESIQNYADAIAGIPSVITYLESIENDGEVDGRTLVTAAQDLASIQRSIWGDTHHIFLTDSTGRVVLSPPKQGWERQDLVPEQIHVTQSIHYGSSIADADYFSRAKEEPTVSGFFDFSERDHYHQLAMHPIKNSDGRTVGVVVIEIDISTAQHVLRKNFRLGETGKIFLTTNKGTRVVHKKHERAELEDIPGGLSQAIVDNELVSGRFEHLGTDVHGTYLPSHIFPWVVCIEMDHDEVVAGARAQQRQFTYIGLFMLSLCALAAVLIARVFGTPIKELVDSATAVASGELKREIQITSGDEIGQLQSAVDGMRCALLEQIDHLDSTVNDRTEQLLVLNKQLKHDSERDKLTGLANRELFHRRLSAELDAYHQDPSRKFAVLFFDFDRFKLVNDSLGHTVGDALLCSIAKRFEKNLRSTDLSARFGGDEFVVVLSPVESEAQARETANRLLRVFKEQHTVDGHEITSTASIGLLHSDARYIDAEDMIRDADAAMYQAKVSGKARVVGFDAAMHESAKRRLKLEEDLYRAIDENQLKLAYQPIVELETLETVGFEALIRWEHPDFGFVRPDQFIDIAEDTGQIVQIGKWVIEQAIEDILDWNSRFGHASKLSVNVNVSKRQMIDESFMPHLRGILKESAIDPSQLRVELTESTIVDPRISDTMSAIFDDIRSLGVQIAMDDFGTGHSSLGLLHKFKFDVLKIDRSFISEMDMNRDIGAVLHAIIELAQNSGMSIVAEGVETESQVTALIAHGCDKVQGYYFAKPMFFEDVLAYLERPGTHKKAA